MASSSALADQIRSNLPHMVVAVVKHARSLGSAIAGGKRRSALLQRQRLRAFRVRRGCFQKVRRDVGARLAGAILRTGGTAALTYGQATFGVPCSTLLAQRRAVAATVSRGSCPGDLDLTLVLADGSSRGRADPAFAAHMDVIGLYADAVWARWLPFAALSGLLSAFTVDEHHRVPWAAVHGPISATVATANRLAWRFTSCTTIVDDTGCELDLTRDSPALVRQRVQDAVWRWRWRRVEAKLPCLVQEGGGYGPFI